MKELPPPQEQQPRLPLRQSARQQQSGMRFEPIEVGPPVGKEPTAVNFTYHPSFKVIEEDEMTRIKRRAERLRCDIRCDH